MKVFAVGLLFSLLAAPLRVALADTYEIDADHADVGFSIKHLGVNTVRGRFTAVKGSVSYDGTTLESLQAQATIQAASIDTGVKKRDDHLRSPDYFDTAKNPEIVFVSKGVAKEGEEYILSGTLLIKGVSKDVSLRCEVDGPIDSPFQPGVKIIGFSGKTKINRNDFGVGSSNASDKLIGGDVKIEINLEAKK